MRAFFKSDILVYIILVGLMIVMQLQRISLNKTEKILNEMYSMHEFDASKLPNGLVIYKSGLPSSYNPTIPGDSTMKYEFFVIGVWKTSEDIVYELIVPKFAYNRFIVGYYIRETNRNDDAPPSKDDPEPTEYKQMVFLDEKREIKNF